MKISKKDALMWFSFFAELPEDEELSVAQQEIVYAVFSQIELSQEKQIADLAAQIPDLQMLNSCTQFVGPAEKFPKGCRSCLFGTGLSAIRKTNRCNIQCPFCYNYGELDLQPPIGEGMWEIGGTRFREEDVELLLATGRKPSGVAYVYLEPFMEIELYYSIIARFAKAGIHQHLYTNGILADREKLRRLGEQGLNELRFNLGASNCSDRVIENIRIAKEYIPRVGIETPMTPEFFTSFSQKKQTILQTGLDFINCAELHLNPNNIENYMGENLYICRHGYISPVWSHVLTMRFLQLASAEKWPVAVHDCCNKTKFARDLHTKAVEGGWFGASDYRCEFERPPFAAFLPILSDDTFSFLEEEELPAGYRPGDYAL